MNMNIPQWSRKSNARTPFTSLNEILSKSFDLVRTRLEESAERGNPEKKIIARGDVHNPRGCLGENSPI